jgi:hypothetical protein
MYVHVLKLSKVSFRAQYAHMENTLKLLYYHQQNSPGWVIFLKLCRRAALPARCSIRICLISGLQCAETFHLAFPERPQEKVDMLASRMANKDGKICEYGHINYPDAFLKGPLTLSAHLF